MYTITNVRTNKTYDLIHTVLDMPNKGCWIFHDTKIDTDEGFQEDDDVSISFIGKNFIGSLVDVEIYAGYTMCTILAGKGTLGTELAAQSFIGTSVKTVVTDIAKKIGMEISPLSDISVLSTSVQRFEKLKDKASNSLNKLLSLVDATWKISIDGKLVVYKESYPDISIKYPNVKEDIVYDVLDKQPNLGWWRIYSEDLLFEPNFAVEGNQVKEVIYDLNMNNSGNIECTWNFFEPQHIQQYEISSQKRDLMFLATYRMKVISQNNSGLLTLLPDPDLELLKNGLRDVPIANTSPEFFEKVNTGSIAYVRFANGDPGRPVVIGFENTRTLSELVIASPSATQNAARKGDKVDCGKFTVAFTSAPMPTAPGSLTVVYVDATGASFPFFSITAPGLTIPPGTTTPTIPITGKIIEGSNRVKIGD